jgi:hypothetical protein
LTNGGTNEITAKLDFEFDIGVSVGRGVRGFFADTLSLVRSRTSPSFVDGIRNRRDPDADFG